MGVDPSSFIKADPEFRGVEAIVQRRQKACTLAIEAAFKSMKGYMAKHSLPELVGEVNAELLVRGIKDRYGVNLIDDKPIQIDFERIKTIAEESETGFTGEMVYKKFLGRMQGTLEAFKRDCADCNISGTVDVQGMQDYVNEMFSQMSQAAADASRKYEAKHIQPLLGY